MHITSASQETSDINLAHAQHCSQPSKQLIYSILAYVPSRKLSSGSDGKNDTLPRYTNFASSSGSPNNMQFETYFK